MSFKLRKIVAYLLDGIEWVFLALATGCTWVSDLAEDAATRLRR